VEFVYVIKRSDLFDLHFPQGFLTTLQHGDEVGGYLGRAKERGFFMERRFAEEDSSFKQLIPYTIVRRGNEVLLLQRSKRGGDSRLHNKLSIGVGGHINPIDAEHDDVLAACACREIDEEIDLGGEVKPRPVGIINDDSNAVGSVHFGVVHVVDAGRADVAVRETELLTARFVAVEELGRLAQDPDVNMETWSRLITARIGDVLD